MVKFAQVKGLLQRMQNGACSFFNSSVQFNSTADDFHFFSAVIRECAFAVTIWIYFIQFMLSLFFPNRFTFVVNVLTDVGFEIWVRNFQICNH